MQTRQWKKIESDLTNVISALSDVESALSSNGTPPPPAEKIRPAILEANAFLARYAFEDPRLSETAELVEELHSIATSCLNVCRSLNASGKLNDEHKGLVRKARDICISLKTSLEEFRLTPDGRQIILPEHLKSSAESTDIVTLVRRLDRVEKSLITIESNKGSLKKLLQAAEKTVSRLREEIPNLEGAFSSEIQKTENLFEEKKAYLENKQQEIDKSFGIASGRILAGGYENQAQTEKRNADHLRWGALACLVSIVALVGYSLFETTKGSITLETALIRLAFSIILSIPAAYLAKESTKHRQQQYHLMQTSLDLSAIGPFLASLPDEAQHVLKAKIADKLFAAKRNESQLISEFPINSHELLIRLLDTIDSQPENKSEKPKR